MIPPGYPEIPVRAKVGLAPWFVAAVIVVGLLSDHGVISLQDAPHIRKPRAHGRAQRATPPPLVRTSGGRMAPRDIYRLARWAGWGPQGARTATAVALAESGGYPRAHNPVPPDDSYCLWQVNMLGDLGPARRATYRLRRNADLYRPATCARVARGIYLRAGGWSPWTTYTRGSYRQFLSWR